jgi:hypothetical protein
VRTAVAALLVVAAACARPGERPALDYPVTRTVAVVDDYHGTSVSDPYRWLDLDERLEGLLWAEVSRSGRAHGVSRAAGLGPAFRRV